MNKKSFLPLIFASFLFTVNLNAQWNANPAINTPVSVILASDQKNVNIITDTKSGAIISWSDYRNNGLGDVYAQRMDVNGLAKWNTNGLSVCNDAAEQNGVAMTDDGKGGTIIVWNDYRNGAADVYAQRVDSTGNILWTLNGVPVVAKANAQQGARVVGDGTGGAFVIWEDSVGLGWDIYAQYINSAGTIQWASAGVAVCSAINSQINPKIQLDNAGGVIICWQDKRNGSDYDILAQRLNGSGVAQWTTNGTFVASLTGTQNNPKMRADGSGGAFIAWQDKRNGSDYDIYVQRINSSGAGQWTVNGVGVVVATGAQSALDMTITNTAGEIIIGWKDERNGNLDIYAQKLNSSGAIQWTANGVPVCTSSAPQINPNLVSDETGGAIITWQDSTATLSDIFSQRISSAGAAVWTTNGIQIGVAALEQETPKNVSDGLGGSIYVFEDKRNGNDPDIYAHRIDANGTPVGLAEVLEASSGTAFPNPFSNFTDIPLSAGTANISSARLVLYDLNAKEVAVSYLRTAGGFRVHRAGLPSGVYFYAILVNGTFAGKGKLVVTE